MTACGKDRDTPPFLFLKGIFSTTSSSAPSLLHVCTSVILVVKTNLHKGIVFCQLSEQNCLTEGAGQVPATVQC